MMQVKVVVEQEKVGAHNKVEQDNMESDDNQNRQAMTIQEAEEEEEKEEKAAVEEEEEEKEERTKIEPSKSRAHHQNQ